MPIRGIRVIRWSLCFGYLGLYPTLNQDGNGNSLLFMIIFPFLKMFKRLFKVSSVIVPCTLLATYSQPLFLDRPTKPTNPVPKQVQIPERSQPLKPPTTREKMVALIKQVQTEMTTALEQFDSKKFLHDDWSQSSTRYGTTCVLQDGQTFEKAGVNISIIEDVAPESLIQQMTHRNITIDATKNVRFFVAGISMVVHPRNPFCPTFHANYRYFELVEDDKVVKSWFGGGCDLTPCYLFEDDAKYFHGVVKDVCDKYDGSFYQKFKVWCDKYFYNTHRGEARGNYVDRYRGYLFR